MRLVLWYHNPEVVFAWTQTFAEFPDVSFSSGNILKANVDALVSPANSFGIMDGGLDAAILAELGAAVESRVQKAILDSLEREKKGTIAESAMKIIDRNIALAKQKSQPICQDTGSILFYVDGPVAMDQIAFEDAGCLAVKKATKKGYLRQNSVDSLTGVNDGTNVGPGSPTFHFHQHRPEEISVRLVLKGGGCENVGAQYSLPNEKLKANRDLDAHHQAEEQEQRR